MLEGELDGEFLDELLDGDKEFAQELFQTYNESADTSFQEATELLGSADQESVFRPFHTLKGASASVGLLRVQALAKEFESMARAREFAECQSRLPELASAIATAKVTLQTYLDSL